MKPIFPIAFLLTGFFLTNNSLTSCSSSNSNAQDSTVQQQDSITNDVPFKNTFQVISNLPCKTIYVHPEKSGKALLVLWLHGGMRDQKLHNLREFNHLDCCAADDSIVQYLSNTDKKAVCLMPVCQMPDVNRPMAWSECAEEVIYLVNQYVKSGLVDKKRVYVTGSSDGGNATWIFSQKYSELFAAGLALSCETALDVNIPVFWHSTKAEGDCSELAKSLQQKGCPVEYSYLPEAKHGGDEIVCTKSFLDKFFSITKAAKK